MTPIELALHSWREQKLKYEKSIKTVISQLSISVKYIPSPEFQIKLEELKQYLHYNYTYDDDQKFLQIYVHYIAGIKNMTLMELSNKLSLQIGGSIQFWQNKIMDIAQNVVYHPQLTLWQVNRAFQRYLGLSPEVTNNLRKKKSLSKSYLAALIGIGKIIQKSKPFQEDLLKIDDSFKKLKKTEEKYYAFLQQTENKRIDMIENNISTKGKQTAKNTLFMFIKSKQQKKLNTLINYNFKTSKQTNQMPSKLLKDQKYQQFDNLFKKLRKQSYSQGYGSQYSKTWSDIDQNIKKSYKQVSLNDLREEFKLSFINEKSQQTTPQSKSHNVFIWSKQYYFSYWNFPIVLDYPIDFLNPFHVYSFINYEIDSSDQFDELNAQDVDAENDSSQNSSQSNNSFVVSDNYQSDQEERQRISTAIASQRDRWSKDSNLKQYELICLSGQTPLALDPNENLILSEQFLSTMNGKSRNQIFSFFEKDVPKSKIEIMLKNNFKKKITKQKKCIYVRHPQTENSKQKNQLNRPIVVDVCSDDQTSDIYQISISNPIKKKPFCPNTTIIQESYEVNQNQK